MRHVYLRPVRLRDQPVSRHRHSRDRGRVTGEALLPGSEVERAWIGREHDELRKRHPGAVRDVGGGLKCRWPIAWQPKDERAEHIDAMLAESAQARDQRLATSLNPL